MSALITSLGPLERKQSGIILSHEHVFVDLRPPDHPQHAAGEAAAVQEVMGPHLCAARSAGIGAIVEASTVGVGRRADILAYVSRSSGMPILVPTGVYREPWIPGWVHAADEARLTRWMRDELQQGIEDSGIRAGWIKLSAGDDGLTSCEKKVLRAAAAAALQTGAVIGSHTIRGRVVRDQLEILEAGGLPPDRFVWIHTQAEADQGLHVEMARRGTWIEYDGIGGGDPDAMYVGLVLKALEAGLEGKVLLSQDRGQYDPARPRGGDQKPYTYLVDTFLPGLARAGVSRPAIDRLTKENPFRAFSR